MRKEDPIDEEQFLSELVEYMNDRYEVKRRTALGEEFTYSQYTKDSPIVKCLDGQEREFKWSVSVNGSIKFPRIEEYLNGEVCIFSSCILEDAFQSDDSFRSYEIAMEEGKELIVKELKSEQGRRKLRSKHPIIVGEFDYGNRVAKEISRETSIKVKYLFPSTHTFSTFFYSSFNSKKMSYDEKMGTIKMVLGVIDMAFERAWNLAKLYVFLTEHEYRKRRSYSSFKEETEDWMARSGIIRFMETDEKGIYAGLTDGRLLAFDRNMNVKWVFMAPGVFEHTIYIAGATPLTSKDGILYLFSRNESHTDHHFNYYFCALDPDGSLKWVFKITSRGKAFIKAPLFSDNIIYLTLTESLFEGICVYALDYEGGLKWSFRNEGFMWISPTLGSDGTLYLIFKNKASDKSYVYAIGADGNLKWKFETKDTPASFIVIDPDKTIYFKTLCSANPLKYRIYSLNPDGSLKWKRYEEKLGVKT
ncbi:MAG: PQQ-binding-like beta-propeller repeat protein [Thermoproteota archaeon]